MTNEIKEMINNVANMSEKERKEQLEWSDTHEFGTAYAYYLLEENKKLKEDYSKIVQDNCYTLELEQRIDKAIANIELGYVVFCEQDKECLMNFRKNILEILKGDE